MPDYIIIREDDHIEHHGTKGQKWAYAVTKMRMVR